MRVTRNLKVYAALFTVASVLAISLRTAVSQENAVQVKTPSDSTKKPVFNRDVLPILAGKCFKCHGPDAASREADLRLDVRADALEYGAITPGQPSESTLIERIVSGNPDLRMPPKGNALTPDEIATLKTWITDGAPYEKHWAYIKPGRPKRPPVRDTEWVQNAIDDFVLARLEESRIKPSPRAEPAVLLRRLYLDLVGLPPTIEEVETFEADPSPARYGEYVDRLLKSQHFGEKWAQSWLDLAHYADSNGYQHDDLRHIWPYRDWVVAALNDGMPFDQFTLEQLAGDLLPSPSRDQLVATGFLRNPATNLSGGAKFPEVRAQIMHDRVSTVGLVWLGMTLECAQCHSHKFDPVSQREYYKLYAYFNNAKPEVALYKGSNARKTLAGRYIEVFQSDLDVQRAKEIREEIVVEEELLKTAKAVASSEQAKWEARFLKENRGKKIPWDRFLVRDRNGDKFLKTPLVERTAFQKRKVKALLFYDHPTTGPHVRRLWNLRDELDRVAPRTMVMQDSDTPPPSHIFVRGDYTNLGEAVTQGVPAMLHSLPENSPPNRLGLARWLVDVDNPLTARVTVNRVWAEIFGQGIVSTLEDFGLQSSAPTHPKLLDWLAVDFVEGHWSLKQLIKTIVMSASYQQSSQASAELVQRDPTNLLYARGPRFRVSAELVRDNLLAVSGLLTRKVGGPPAFPPQPGGLWQEIAGADVSAYRVSTGEERYRRGIYTIWRRGNPNPSMINFDASNRALCVVRRPRTNTPLQALTLLNDPVYVEAAEVFATRIKNWDCSHKEKMIRAFRCAVARQPADKEVVVLLQIFQAQKSWFAVAQSPFEP